MSCLKLSVLYLGKITCARDRLIQCDEKTTLINSPMSAVLIQHPTLGNILYDTGNSPYYHSEYGDTINAIYPVTEFISIEEALAEHGLRCEDINLLILSHLHFDHAGGLRYFIGTKAAKHIVVAKSELAYACLQVHTGKTGGAYVRTLFDHPDFEFKTIDQSTKLSEDILLFIQHAHTPGVIGMVIKTESFGYVIIPSDTLYTRESYQCKVPPGGNINQSVEEFYQNSTLIDHMKTQYHATLFHGHDYEQVREWAALGEII